VLSGFVLVWSDSPAAGHFYRRRFARIYPAYIVALGFALLMPISASSTGVLALIPSVLLLQAWSTQSAVAFGGNDVSWSLSCEAFFYALFPFLLPAIVRLRRQTLIRISLAAYTVAAVAVIVGVAVSQAAHNPGVDNLVYTDPLLRLPEFLLGMTAALVARDGWRPPFTQVQAIVALAVVYVSLCLVHAPGPLLDAATPLLFVAIVSAAAVRDLEHTTGWLTHRWFVYAGEASFCFYLVHEVVILNVGRLVTGLAGSLLALTASCAAAAVLHHGVERPLQRRWRGGWPRSDTAAVNSRARQR
jgi:peptidoglycan/LPS O-acetylase OafA/YrhL